MSEKKEYIIVKEPRKQPKLVKFEKPSLRLMQKLVGGYIDLVRDPILSEHGIDMFVNDEGLFAGPNGEPLDANVVGQHQILYGPAVFTSSNTEGDTIPLTEHQITVVKAWCRKYKVETLEKIFPDSSIRT